MRFIHYWGWSRWIGFSRYLSCRLSMYLRGRNNVEHLEMLLGLRKRTRRQQERVGCEIACVRFDLIDDDAK